MVSDALYLTTLGSWAKVLHLGPFNIARMYIYSCSDNEETMQSHMLSIYLRAVLFYALTRKNSVNISTLV